MFFFSHSPANRRRAMVLRGLAVFFAALYMLSAVRGFVPGMCATQTAMAMRNHDNYAQTCSIQPTKACCPSTGALPASNTSEQDAPVPAASCVFCVLAKALVKTVGHYHYEAPTFTSEAKPAEAPELAYVANTPTALHDRAPPAA